VYLKAIFYLLMQVIENYTQSFQMTE